MVQVFHGTDAKTHQDFQDWRRANVDGFHMTESSPGSFVIHYAQDHRENAAGRGCCHQGVSDLVFREDKGACYTTERKFMFHTLGS